MQEIAGIIDSSFTAAVVEEAPELKHEPAPAAVSPAQSLTLLKQHIEIVSLNEELQKVKLEKQELENELSFRSREEQSLLVKNADLERNYQGEISEMQKSLDDSQAALEKALVDNQRKTSDMTKMRNAVIRLKADLNLVENDITGFRETYPGVDILKQSILETLGVFNDIQLMTASRGHSWDQKDEEDVQRGHKSLSDLPEWRCSETSESIQREQSIEFSALIAQKSELEQEKLTLESKYDAKKAKHKDLKRTLEMLQKELKKSQESAHIAEQQLAMKVRGIEEERATMNIEIEFRDQQILTLQQMLMKEQEKLEEIISIDSPKRKVKESEERVVELQYERRKVTVTQLYDEIVALRKAMDTKDEEIQNLKNKYERLERNLGILTQKQSHAQSPDRPQLSPRGPPAPVEHVPVSSKNIVKPIRGGDGDVWSFRKSNQEIDIPAELQRDIPHQKIKTKISKIKETRPGTGIKAMIGGFFSKLI